MEIHRLSATNTYALIPLIDVANRPSYKANPTLAAGDIKVVRHTGGAWTSTNINTLPSVAFSGANTQILVTLSATEVTSDNLDYPISVVFIDQTATKEWDDNEIVIWTKPIPSNLMQISATAISTPATAGILDVNAKNINNVSTSATTTINANIGQTQPLNFTGTGASAFVKSDMQDILGAAVSSATAQIGTNVISFATGSILDSTFASATYPKALRTSTAVSGAASSITLDAGASTVADFYTGCSIKISSGTGAGQSRTIILYTTERIAYVDRSWATNPDNTSIFVINSGKYTVDVVNTGLAISGTINTITFASAASSVEDFYDGSIVQIIGGTGVGQSRIITAYNGTTKSATVYDQWGTNPDSTSLYVIRGLGDVEANIISIRSASATAVNLAAQFDGSTGLIGSTYPARQDQLSTIVSTGAATNTAASSWANLSSPASTETGGVSATAARDGTYDVITNTSAASDSYYEFNIGGTGVPTGVSIYAAVQNGAKTVRVYGYNWNTSTWTQVGTLTGTAGLTLTQYTLAMYTNMVGTGVNSGNVRIRLLASAASTTITVDQIYVSYATVSTSVGYLDGAIWIDTINGVSGTTLRINGTADNPVNSYANALTLATALNVKRFHLSPDSTITLTQNHDNWVFAGKGNIIINGQSIADAIFRDCEHITGISSGQDAYLINCNIGDLTIDTSTFIDCQFDGILTTVVSGGYTVRSGIDAIPGLANPTFICAANATYGLRDWRGGINIASMASTNNFYIDGQGRVVIQSSCTGGNLTIRGSFDILDQVSGGFSSVGTLTDTARWNENQNIANVTGSVASVTNRVTANADQIYSVSAAALQLSISAPTMVSATVTSAAFAPTITQFETADIITSASNFYTERTIIFTSGTLQNEARTITAYSLQGSNGRFTVNALTSAPINGDTFIIV